LSFTNLLARSESCHFLATFLSSMLSQRKITLFRADLAVAGSVSEAGAEAMARAGAVAEAVAEATAGHGILRWPKRFHALHSDPDPSQPDPDPEPSPSPAPEP
jgi:hypothetical protein